MLDVQVSYFDYIKDNCNVCFCVSISIFVFCYLLKKFTRGRAQMKRNCELIEKQLQYLQKVIEENERKEREEKYIEGNVEDEPPTESAKDK